MILIRTPPLDEIARRWNEIEPPLKRATDLTQGCYEPVDVLALVCAGRLMMMLIEDDDKLMVVVVIEIRIFPRRKTLDASYIGGVPGSANRVKEWAPMLVEHLEKLARHYGATLLTGWGRIGWAKCCGYKIVGGYMTREVEANG